MPPEYPRRIIHVDMDAFYASVEQRDDPSLRGRPVVVAWRGPRSVVCAASYEARRYGIRSAMPAISAERRCPEAVFVAPDFSRYKAVSTQIRTIFARYTPLIEPLSLDEAYLDVSLERGGLPTATAVAVAIRSAIRDELALTASAGVAPNKFVAKIASDFRKPDGLTVVRPTQVLDFLAPLDVGKLPGVGKVMRAQLDALGLTTIAALREADLALLTQRFGRYGERLHQLARGLDDHPVEADRPRLSISSEDTFATDLALAELAQHIDRLAARVQHDLQRHRNAARTITLKLKTAQFQILTRRQSVEQPIHDAPTIARIARDLRARVDLPDRTRYRLVGVGASGLVALGSEPLQTALFDPA